MLFAVGLMVLTSGAAFFATPIIIREIGKTDFGLYHLILEFIAYISICELGLTSPSYGLLNKAWISRDRSIVKRTIRVLVREYLKLTPLLIFVPMVLLICFFYFSAREFRQDVFVSFLMMASTALLIPLHVFRSFVMASEKSHILSKISSVQLILLTALNIGLTLMGFGLIGLAVAFLITTLFLHGGTVFLAIQQVRKMEDKGGEPDIDVKSIWNVSIHGTIQDLLGRVSYHSDAMILSLFAPAAMITNLVTNQRAATLMDSLLKTIGSSTWASVTRVRDNKEELQRVLNAFNIFFPLASHPLAFALAYNNRDFINLWLGAGFYISDAFTWIVFANFSIFCVLAFWAWLFVGFGKVPVMTVAISTSGIINIIASVFFAYLYGPIGPVLGTFVAFFFYYVWHLRYLMRKELEVDVTSYLKNYFILSVVLGLVYIGLQRIELFDGNSWLGLIGNLTVVYAIALVVSLIALMRKRHFGLIAGLFRSGE